MGKVSNVLGMNITHDRDKGTIVDSHRKYTKDVLERLVLRAATPIIRLMSNPSYS